MARRPTLRERVVFEAPERRRALLAVIAAARTRLSLSLYRMDDGDVWSALVAAARRGVAVEVLVTPRAKGGRRELADLVARMEQERFAVRRYRHAFVKYHAKYLIADDRVGVVASLNLTRRCFDQTCDFLVVTECRDAVAGLVRLFDADFRGSDSGPDYGPRLVVAPETARAWYSALISAARRRLRIIDHKISDTAVLKLIRNRERAGVRVEILDRGDLDPMPAHGKLLLVDDRVAALGSIALAPRHLDHRRELAIVLSSRPAVDRLGRYFDRLARRRPATPIEHRESISCGA
jgi:phosphatidylserine/phosphatidylglycerophosphate/cardiolipin synthase-like enzyme